MNKDLYSNEKYKLMLDNGDLYLYIHNFPYKLTYHPYEPTTYIHYDDITITMHNGFDLSYIIKRIEENDESFSTLNFCRNIEYEILKYKSSLKQQIVKETKHKSFFKKVRRTD